MRLSGGVLVLVVSALLAGAPARAAGTPPLREIVAASGGPMLTNGGSFTARDRGDAVVVTEVSTHRHVLVQKPAPCEPPYVETQLVAIGGSVGLLDSCPAGQESMPTVFDLRSGSVRASPVVERVPDSYANVSAVGNRWIRVTLRQYHSTGVEYLDWRTGESRYDDGDARVAPDLSRASLLRPLCSPLKRQEDPYLDPYDVGPRFVPYAFSGAFGVTTIPFRDENHHGKLVFQRCGSHARTLLDRDCGSVGCQAQIGAGVVSWLEERPGDAPNLPGRVSAHAYVIRSGRRLSWRLPAGAEARVAHTRHALYVSVAHYSGRQTWQIFKARLPR